jgi:hypothetical protein
VLAPTMSLKLQRHLSDSSTSTAPFDLHGAGEETGGTFLNVTREAAHNLVLLLKRSGATELALEVMMKHLVC